MISVVLKTVSWRPFAIFPVACIANMAVQGTTLASLPDFDIRMDNPALKHLRDDRLASDRQVKREERGREIVQDFAIARIDYNAMWGTPDFLGSLGGRLTPPVGDKSVLDLVTQYLDTHSELFGVRGDALQSTIVTRDAVTAHNGVRTIWWQQVVNGAPLIGCDLRANFTRKGELISIGSRLLPVDSVFEAAGTHRISEVDALRRASVHTDVLSVGNMSPTRLEQRNGRGASLYDARPQVVGITEVERVYFPVTESVIQPAYLVHISPAGQNERYELVVDAESGTLLYRQALGRSGAAEDATFRLWTNDSPAPLTPGPMSPNGVQPTVDPRELITTSALDSNASPEGWIPAGANEPVGNNANAHTDLDADNFPDLPRPQGSPFRTFDFPVDLMSDPAVNRDAAITQVFYMANWFHDRMYQLGFTPAFGNFQMNNFGQGGAAGDAIQIDIQDGEISNNARFFSSGLDGTLARAEFALFDGPDPDRDSAFDNQIAVHEFQHGVSVRLHGGLVGPQADGLNEGWSDFVSLSLLAESGDPVEGTYPVGGYSTFEVIGTPFVDNYYFGVRRLPYSTNFELNPLTFADIDPIQFDVDPDVPISFSVAIMNPGASHNMGEVWCSALWDCRASLIQKLGPVSGNETMLRLVLDGMKLTTTFAPNMLQSRFAILLADEVTNGGANTCDLWNAFASRGFGYNAISIGNDLSLVIEDFTVPDQLEFTYLGGSQPTVALPGEPTPVEFIVSEMACTGNIIENEVTVWFSMNDGEFTALPTSIVTPGVYASVLPAMTCNDSAKFYVEANTSLGVQFDPPAGAMAPFDLSVATTPFQQEIRASDGANLDHFGLAIDIEGDVMAVGSPRIDDFGNASGAVYVYERQPNGSWLEKQKLTASDAGSGRDFGWQVDISGSLLAVTAPRNGSTPEEEGVVYVFERLPNGDWVEEARIANTDVSSRFGDALVLEGDVLLAGARQQFVEETNEPSGAVYVYRRVMSGQWNLETKLFPADAEFVSQFGRAIAFDGQRAVIGAPASDFVIDNSGSVHFFTRSSDGTWSEDQMVTLAQPFEADAFGSSVALRDETAFVAASQPSGFGPGKVEVYVRDELEDWQSQSTLAPSDGFFGDLFGEYMAVSDDALVVGSVFHTDGVEVFGAAYVFREIAVGMWSEETKLTPESAVEGSYVGADVAIRGDLAAIGAKEALTNTMGIGPGVVYTFSFNGMEWTADAGDCNGNGVFDTCDIESRFSFDVNENGVPDKCEDLLVGDLNGDGVVNGADLAALLAQWGGSGSADLNNSGSVDGADLAALLANWTS